MRAVVQHPSGAADYADIETDTMTRDESIQLKTLLEERVRPLLNDLEGEAITILGTRCRELTQLTVALWQAVDALLAREITKE
jgi:hypothetical protein